MVNSELEKINHDARGCIKRKGRKVNSDIAYTKSPKENIRKKQKHLQSRLVS